MNLLLIHLSSVVALVFYPISFFYPSDLRIRGFTREICTRARFTTLRASIVSLSVLSHFISLAGIIFGRLLFKGDNQQLILDYLPLPVMPVLVSSFALLGSYFYSQFRSANNSAMKSVVLFYIGYILFFISSLTLHTELITISNHESYVGIDAITGIHIILSIGSQVLSYLLLSLGLVIMLVNKVLLSNKPSMSQDVPALIPSIKLLESLEYIAILLVFGSLVSGYFVHYYSINGAMESKYGLKILFTFFFLILLLGTITLRYFKRFSAIKISYISTIIWLVLLLAQNTFKFIFPVGEM